MQDKCSEECRGCSRGSQAGQTPDSVSFFVFNDLNHNIEVFQAL